MIFEYIECVKMVKPPGTRKQLIENFMKKKGKVKLREIIDHFIKTYPYFKEKEKEDGWKNSIRQLLTTDKMFVLEKIKNKKGGYWHLENINKTTPKTVSMKMKRYFSLEELESMMLD